MVIFLKDLVIDFDWKMVKSPEDYKVLVPILFLCPLSIYTIILFDKPLNYFLIKIDFCYKIYGQLFSWWKEFQYENQEGYVEIDYDSGNFTCPKFDEEFFTRKRNIFFFILVGGWKIRLNFQKRIF